jgi:hypothetical protein
MTLEDRIVELLALLQGGTNAAARELVRTVLELHGQALDAVLEHVQADAALIARIAADERVRGVLLLHGLHPEPAAERVGRALRALPDVRVTSLSVERGVMRLAVACTRRPRPGDALAERVRGVVLEAAPELDRVEIAGLPAEQAVIPIVAAKS